MCIHDITFVQAVEEFDSFGNLQWWMSIQDITSMQVWIIHFASLQRLESWVTLLRTITSSTQSRSVVSDIIYANASCLQPIKLRASMNSKTTVLSLFPVEPI
jgi:hypothetical protein